MQWDIGAGAVAILIVLAALLWRARRPGRKAAAPAPNRKDDPAQVWLTGADGTTTPAPPRSAAPTTTDDPSASPAGQSGDAGTGTD